MKFLQQKFTCLQKTVVTACIILTAVSCSSDGTHSAVPANGASAVESGATAGNTSSNSVPSGVDMFDGNGPLLDYTTNNEFALPSVVRKDGRYLATLLDNADNVTLHFKKQQGRLDAKRLSFPFEFIARNIGIGTASDPQTAPLPDDFSEPSKLFMFAGIQVHVLDLEKADSAHLVVGHRGDTSYTVEGKNTVDGKSKVNDARQGIVPAGRADLRVVGDADKSLTWYWQQPNLQPDQQADDWIAYRGNGKFPGQQTSFGNELYVGLITYAFGASSVPFVGTADSIEWVVGKP